MADEPTRTCGRCGGNRSVTEMETSWDKDGKRTDKNVTRTCPDCDGTGVR